MRLLGYAPMTTTVEPDTRFSYGTLPGDPSKALTIGGVGAHLTPAEVTEFVVMRPTLLAIRIAFVP